MSRTVPFATPEERAAALPDVVAHLRSGGILAYPTETVYGLGCALLPEPLAALAAGKRPGGHRPFLLLVPDGWDASDLEWTADAERLARAFWPGPLTLALAARPGAFPAEVTAADGSVAIRHSPHPAVRAIVQGLDAPITSTSANAPGEPPARDAAGAAAAVDRLGLAGQCMVLDGGRLQAAAASTLVHASTNWVRILRTGSIPDDDLRRVLRDRHGE